ncbi:hypothetical protein AVEN_177095-1 [Araneus ventricosus]|uniref:Uncharacterized protein n=1 Tax=Araneus ventricosus TaxID=182803 RepID=A0A4Y2CT69_ARAVE|nr:hypothetical protein AVEN_177095-1 [Araneus ventricosus]
MDCGGVTYQGVVSPFFFENGDSCENYLQFIWDNIYPLLQQRDLFGELLWQQDYAFPHTPKQYELVGPGIPLKLDRTSPDCANRIYRQSYRLSYCASSSPRFQNGCPRPDFSTLTPNYPLPILWFHFCVRGSVPLTDYRISALWPSGQNGHTNRMEFQLFPRSTTFLIGFLHYRSGLASCVREKVEWPSGECPA